MSLGIVRSHSRGLTRLAQRGGQVSFSNQRVRQIHVRLNEFRIPSQRRPEMCNRGIDFILREQHPAERIVPLRALRHEP